MNSSPSDDLLALEQRELLICLANEAADVIKIVHTLLHASEPTDNNRTLLAEVGNFLGIVSRLTELEIFDEVDLANAAEQKLIKLENYLLYENDTDIVAISEVI